MFDRLDKHLVISIFLLFLFGLVMIYSSSSIWAQYKFFDRFHYVKFQLFFSIIGIILMLIISKINYHLYKKYATKILIVCIILLILVLIPGIGSIRNGSRSWFGIGALGIQPSEFVKLAMIIFTSKYLEKNNKYIKNIKKSVIPILIVSFFIFTLIMLQPDLGTGVIFLLTVIALLFIAGVNIKFFIYAVILGIIGIIILIIIAPYRMDRIMSFINPWKDPLGTGFQIIQSLFAIGPGGLLGMGFLNSVQKHFYLPEPQTDFIFSIIAEEFGIVGAFIVCILFGIILLRGIKISLNSNNLFAKYLSFGITFQLIIQCIINLFVVIGLIPVTGVTLPFLSYGGSSLIISMISMGIILNISRSRE